MALKNNTWKLNQWYDQNVAGNVSYSSPFAGELWAWGENGQGSLGLNNITTYSSPIQVGTDTNWSVLNNSGSEAQAGAGIKSDGTLWMWGRNQYGALGLNDRANRSSPTQIPGTWLVPNDDVPYNDRTGSIQVRNDGTLAVKSDGTLWSWGYSNFGQLGDSQNNVDYSSPVQVGTDTTWKHVTGGDGGNGVAGLKTDGTLWVWGRNQNGSLGLGSLNEHRSSPTQLPGTTWFGITMQAQTTQAIKTDGTLWVWGGNNVGQLGLNNTTSHYSPVQMPGTWRNCGCTVADSQLALKTDGTLWAWGRNENGELGVNNRTNYSSPIQIPGTTWVNITASRAASTVLATKSDGTLWSWGANQKGILGQNQGPSIQARSSPTQIPGTWETGRLAGGYANAFAIKEA